jgi:hypothetical protein
MEPWIIIILLGLAIIVYARIFNNNESQPTHDKLIAEMEDTFEHFAMEIEDENKQLLEHVLSLKQQYDGQNLKLLTRIEFLEKQFLEKKAETIDNPAQSNGLIVKRMNKPMAIKSNDRVEQTEVKEKNNEPAESSEKTNKMEIKQRYQHLFELHDQGKSMEYISKKLSMNKGEVQLILQLAKQEEQSSV